jgi:hypothetical protein
MSDRVCVAARTLMSVRRLRGLHTVPVPVLVAGIVVVISASVTITLTRDGPPSARLRFASYVGLTLPPQYEVPVSQVDQGADFTVYHPATSSANDSTVTHAYLMPGGGRADNDVELTYPLPAAAAHGVRLRYLIVSEQPWPFGEPDGFFNSDIAGSPDIGKRRCDFDNVPALCVQADSPSDATHENPAYVAMDIDNVSVELMGGNDLQELLAVAHSLTSR